MQVGALVVELWARHADRFTLATAESEMCLTLVRFQVR
jgi:hypothetical protein